MYTSGQPRARVQTQYFRHNPAQQAAVVGNLTQGWFPFNNVALGELAAEVRTGVYRNDREALIEKVKADPSLFMHCARTLASLVPSSESGVNPIYALRILEEEQLEQLLQIRPSDVSAHRLDKLSRPQALRLQHSLVSSYAAETLAAQVNLSPEVAYCAAAVRELGENLVAWNFPSVHLKAQLAEKRRARGETFNWAEELGVSPTEANKLLAQEWKLSAEIIAALEPGTGPHSSSMSVGELCDIAQLFAKSQDPLNYREATVEWKNREAQLSKYFNLDMLETVRTKTTHALSAYAIENKVLDSLPLAQTNVSDEVVRDRRLIVQNVYASRCEPELQSKFSSLYEQLDFGQLSLEGLRGLIRDVVPACGFDRGCLYLLDIRGKALTPTLRFGDVPLENYGALLHTIDTQIVPLLFQTTPIKKRGVGVQGGTVTQVFSGLNSGNHLGLLYFELGGHIENDPSHTTFLYFAAVRKGLIDCLG